MRMFSFTTLLLLGALAPLAIAPTAQAAPDCIPTSGGLDYPSYLCTDPSDPLCPVYTVTTTDWGTTKRCFGILEQ